MRMRRVFSLIWCGFACAGMYMAWEGSKELSADFDRLNLGVASLNWPQAQCEVKESGVRAVEKEKS